MAETDERLTRAKERVDMAEGYMTDAEFREEHDTRVLRYHQATCNALLALYLQNQVIIEMLRKQQDADSLGAGR